jgi:hypothetical protein
MDFVRVIAWTRRNIRAQYHQIQLKVAHHFRGSVWPRAPATTLQHDDRLIMRKGGRKAVVYELEVQAVVHEHVVWFNIQVHHLHRQIYDTFAYFHTWSMFQQRTHVSR